MQNNRSAQYVTIGALIVFMLSLPVWWRNIYWIHILCFVIINVLLTSSLRTISLTGEISLGTGGFMMVGAYSSALLSIHSGLSVWICILVGGMVSALLALILGNAIMRTKGVYFSILTLLTSEILRLTMWYWTSVSGGPSGLRNIPSPDPLNLFGIISIPFNNKINNYYMILVIVVLCLLVLYRFERALGLRWMALKKSDILSESIGIDVYRYRLLSLIIGCFFMGIAGALFAHYMHLLEISETGKFGVLASIYIVIYLVVGGELSFFGPILGAFILTLLPEFARPLQEYQPIIFGLLVILIMYFMRQGLMGLPGQIRQWWRRAGGMTENRV
jgi:branched-chain amino acid transport system permease protein